MISELNLVHVKLYSGFQSWIDRNSLCTKNFSSNFYKNNSFLAIFCVKVIIPIDV